MKLVNPKAIQDTLNIARDLYDKIKTRFGDNCTFLPEFTITGKVDNPLNKDADTLLGMIDLLVVDNNGNDTNELLEREELHNRGKLHNEVTIYIINNKKEVLLQRRSKNRRFCPNMLGVIAGHVSYNETPLVCAGREIIEEVGVRINKNNIHPLYDRYLVKEKFNNHFMYPFYAVCNKEASEFKVQKEELSYVKWYSIDKVIKMIKEENKELVFKKEEIPLFEKLKNIELQY